MATEETIKTNNQRIYEFGHRDGKELMLNDVITSQEEFLEGKPQTHYDLFWDAFQSKGSAKSYYYAFSYNRFSDETFNPKYNIVCNSSGNAAQNLFYNSTLLTDTKVPIDVTRTNHIGGMCYGMTSLKTFNKLIIANNTTSGGNNAFYNCSALENIVIEGEIAQNMNFQWSILLSKASIKSIINTLSTTTEGLSVTFSEAAVNKAFETSGGLVDGSTSAEWIALAGNETTDGIRPKWNILLV